MGGIFRSIGRVLGVETESPRGPSAAEIQRQERERVERERQEQQRRQQEQARLDLEEDRRRRAAFRGGQLNGDEEDLGRRTILGG